MQFMYVFLDVPKHFDFGLDMMATLGYCILAKGSYAWSGLGLGFVFFRDLETDNL